jgi:protein-histidine pros-kinase
LVIEDDEDVTLLYRLALESAGHDVQTVTSGTLGLQRAADDPPDVVVLDGMLPDLDGLEVLTRLGATAATAHVPVIMASARVGSTDQQAASDRGAAAYLVKPFDPQQLTAVVARVTGVQTAVGPAAPNGTPSVAVGATFALEGQPALEVARAEVSLSQALNLAFDAIVSADEDQRIVGFNKGAELTFGYLAEEVLGKPLDLLMPERFTTVHRNHVGRFADERGAGRLMADQRYIYGRRRDGSEFPAEASITKLEIDGRPVLTAILRDATERQRTERELRTRAAQQAAVANLGLRAITAPSVAALLDDVASTLANLLDVDLVKVASYDAAAGELLLVAGHGWEPGVVGAARPETHAGTVAGYTLASAGPVVSEDLAEDARFGPDDLLRTHSAVSGVQVALRGRARPVGLLGVYTRQRRAFTTDDVNVLQAIANVVSSAVERESHEERLRSFLDAAPDATIVVDADGHIVSANAQAEALFGYTREELLRLGVDALVPEGVRIRHAAHRNAYAEERRQRSMGEGLVLSARRRDGSTVPVDIMLRPLDTDEGPLVVAAVRDVTERRRNETIREAFLHAVSHELRTPLTSIIGFSALLTDHMADQLSEDALGLVQRVRGSAGKLERLLGDLLDLDRLRRGILEAQRHQVDIEALVHHTLETLSTDGRSLQVVVEPPGLKAEVDPAQVERIIENLVVNAVRHTPASASIEVRVGRSTNGILLVVEDDGPGVPLAQRDRIFEPFQRDPGSSNTPGTGIGLSLVARFAELHGGRAWVEERPGGGSSFRVVLAT